jgi:hypothetical protein
LEQADPKIPAQLNDRASDAWAPLLAIADTAGGQWPERARNAAIKLCGLDDTESIQMMLLADICEVFEATDESKISSKELVERLNGMTHRPWAEFKQGSPLTQNKLAFLLHAFEISPQEDFCRQRAMDRRYREWKGPTKGKYPFRRGS